MTIDNKARFKNGQHAKTWSQVTGSEAYAEAVNTSILIMVASQAADSPTAQFFRLEGARQVLGILSNLTTERPDSPVIDQNLKTNV